MAKKTKTGKSRAARGVIIVAMSQDSVTWSIIEELGEFHRIPTAVNALKGWLLDRHGEDVPQGLRIRILRVMTDGGVQMVENRTLSLELSSGVRSESFVGESF